jgi:hypothetical protein
MPLRIPKAVVASPLLTAPRLACADAYTKEDPVFTEYVHASVRALARRRRAAADGPDPEFLLAHRLAFAHQARWFPSPPEVKLGLRRGFPEALGRVSLDFWLREGPGLRAQYPLLKLHLSDVAGRCAELAPTLGGILALTLVGSRLEDADIAALRAHPAARGLVWLDLSGNALTFDSLVTLAADAPALRWLGFAGNRIADPTWQWVDHDGALYPDAKGDSRGAVERLGPLPWLEPPPFRATWQEPELYYPLPDLP